MGTEPLACGLRQNTRRVGYLCVYLKKYARLIVTINLRNTTLLIKNNNKKSLCIQTNTLNCYYSVNINE